MHPPQSMAESVPVECAPAEGEDLSTALVAALSEAKGRDVTEDEYVLYDSIDPDALDALFRTDRAEDTLKIEFTTHDAIVVIWNDGRVCIEVQDLESDPTRA